MKTTIMLDADVAEKLRAKARKTGRSLKDVVNDALRNGLAAESHMRHLTPFTFEQPQLIRLKRGFNYDKVDEIFDQVDTPHRLG